MNDPIQTNQKALKVNLNPHIYGSFAEIGAGQEVARHFFQAGGASGTIAKTISAYDMVFSDSIYGKEKSGRYVSEGRLEQMLDKEFNLVLQRLKEKKHEKTLFFSFADTIAAINYHKTNKDRAHGWIGIRFQLQPGGESNEIRLHVKLHDSQNLHQQEAVGVLGVNLVYGAFYNHRLPIRLLESLMDGLDRSRLEIDFIKCSGPDLSHISNAELNIHLVRDCFTSATMFNTCGDPVLPQDNIYKKSVLVARGSYRPPTLTNFNMIESGLNLMAEDFNEKKANLQVIAEISTATFNNEEHTNEDFISRIQLLNELNYNVLITNFNHFSKLNSYLKKMGVLNLGITLGVFNFIQIFEEKYKEIEGGILAALGELVEGSVRVYVLPSIEEGEIITLSNLKLSDEMNHLLQYLKETQKVREITSYDEKTLHIYSKMVLNLLKEGKEEWKQMVPKQIIGNIESLYSSKGRVE